MKARSWRRLRFSRRIVQWLSLALFLGLMLSGMLGASPGPLGSLFLRLDPLAGLMTMLAARAILPAFWPALGLVLLTLALGRAWCGWLCPLGMLLEWSAPRRARWPLSPPWGWAKYGLLLVLLVGALWSVQFLALLDPLSLLERGLAAVLRPVLTPLVFAWGVPHFHIADLWPALLLLAVVALNAAAPRLWCRVLCPLGALLGLVARVAWLRRQVADGCSGCGDCARTCPMGAIEEKTWESDGGECILCLGCARGCPQEALTWGGPSRARPGPAFDPSRRLLLISLGAGLLAGGLLRLERLLRAKLADLLRPPGAVEDELLARCIRCGACVSVCPTGALRPAFLGVGLEALWTPVLRPRSGYCRYACNACGQVCPSGAIPALPLDEKQLQVVGVARVDAARCLTWTENQRCTVCRDTCPVPGPAIELVAHEVVSALGERVLVDRPRVVEALCIGCGVCEYNCPVHGEGAIRVYPCCGHPKGSSAPDARYRLPTEAASSVLDLDGAHGKMGPLDD